jgi:hypothetical protein
VPLQTFDWTSKEALDHLYSLETHWSGWLSRQTVIRALAEGEWGTVFRGKDGKPDSERPLVANLFRLTVEDGGRLFAEAKPSTRVDAAGDDEKRRAERKEMIVAGYDSASRSNLQLNWKGQDMLAAGLTGTLTWPEMRRPINERFPIHRRLEPDTLLPEPRWVPYQPTEMCSVHYRWPIKKLVRTFANREIEGFPEFLDEIRAHRQFRQRSGGGVILDPGLVGREMLPPDMEMLDVYTTDWIVRIALYREAGNPEFKDGQTWNTRGWERAIVLTTVPNVTEICPVQLAARPSWSREPRGQLDDTLGVTQFRNRFFRIILDYFVQMVYGPTVVYGIQDPDPAKDIWRAVLPDWKAQKLGPENMSYQVLNIMDLLEKEDRTGKTAPLSREGDVEDLNKASAAFLTRAQGQLQSVVKSLQEMFAESKVASNEAAMAQDVAWCNASKKTLGKQRGKRFSIQYTPKNEIGKDYQNRVEYGLSSGYDAPTHRIMMLQSLGKTMSIETFMENDPFVDDAATEMLRLARERQRDLILNSLVGQDPGSVIGILGILNRAVKEGRNIDWAIEQIQTFQEQQAAQAQAAAAPPAALPGEPAGLPSGGPPGIAGAEQPIVERMGMGPVPIPRGR